MGGDTITGILDRDYWCADSGYTLILQPMSHQNVLRYWLIHNEFHITHEELVRDSGTIYQLFTAEAGAAPEYGDAELFTGKYEQLYGDPLFCEYLDGLIKKFSAAIRGMESGQDVARGRIELNRGVLRGLQEMKERMQNG
jgi:tRNA (adenine22-N1)-methyltransferase